MRFNRKLTVSVAAVAVVGTIAIAGGHAGNPAVTARNAHMQLYSHNLGILGDMAKGEAEYNADLAQAAADNLAALATFNQMSYWVPGTSNAELGDETRALPAGFDPANLEDVIAKSTAMAEAALAMKEAAGSLEGIQASIGGVGEACGACHKAYRAPRS